jgi:acetyltransferase-like isoleucine patch superfamily enzyme
MKTTAMENIVISAVLFVIVFINLICMSYIISLTNILFQEYHVIIDVFLFIFLFILLSAATIRILLRISPLYDEKLNMLSNRAFYWKLITSVTEIGGMYFIPFIPLFLRPLFYSLFGATIGKNAEIAGKLIELPLITIEEYALVGGGTLITAHAIVHDHILLKPIKISRKATIGLGAIIMPGVSVGENSVIAPGAVVLVDTKIPPNEFWGGVPAKKIKTIEPAT